MSNHTVGSRHSDWFRDLVSEEEPSVAKDGAADTLARNWSEIP